MSLFPVTLNFGQKPQLVGNRAVAQPASLRPLFGGQAADRFTPRFAGVEDVRPYHRLFTCQPELKYSAQLRDTGEAYELLPASMQEFVDELTQQIDPDEMGAYFASHKLGVLEEYGDMLSEYYSLRALQDGIISQKQLENMASAIIGPGMFAEPGKQRPFAEVFKEVSDSLIYKDVREFQTMTGIEDSDLAAEFLAVICFKFAIFMANGDTSDTEKITRDRMIGEAEEFGKKLDNTKVKNWLKDHARDYSSERTRPKDMPLETLPAQLMGRRFGLEEPLKHDDVLRFSMTKLHHRQQLDYERGNDPDPTMQLDYKNRKDVLKRFEALHEAVVLKANNITPQRAMQAVTEADTLISAKLPPV